LVLPLQNTTFEVVFLARQVGSIENTLYIHSSKGSFKYQVGILGVRLDLFSKMLTVFVTLSLSVVFFAAIDSVLVIGMSIVIHCATQVGGVLF